MEEQNENKALDYKKLLNDGFSFWRWHAFDVCKADSYSHLEYLSCQIFEFTTYDGEVDELFAKKAVEVCEAILNRTTFKYIKDEDNYKWYLIMCNMPFFVGRLEWGTSVRGAWWNNGETKYESCGLFDGDKQVRTTHDDPLKLSGEEWKKFIKAIIEFSNEQKEE